MHEPGPPRATSVGRSVELAPRAPDPEGRYDWTVRESPAASAVDRGATATADGNGESDGNRESDGNDNGENDGNGNRESDGNVLEAGETSRPDDPVVHLTPDVPGTYVLTLDAPDGTHRQRVRAFPDERRPTEVRVPAADMPIADDAVDRVSVMWRHNDRLLARDRPDRDGDEWVYRTRVPPGRHDVGFLANDDLETGYWDAVEVPGPGRPRLSLDAHVEDGEEGDELGGKGGDELGGKGGGELNGKGGDEPNGENEDELDGAGGTDRSPRVVVTADIDVPPGSERDPADVDVAFLVDDRDADADAVSRIEDRAGDRTLTVPLGENHDGIRPETDILRVHAVPNGERHGVMRTVRIERNADGSVTTADPHTRPAWADSPTIYEVFVRSFTGGTLPTTFDGIEKRIPYLESVGVDALWLTPVLASPTEHGYHVTDYFETAADLGSRAAFESLVDRCHDAGIRVIFDLVINHTSRDHPAFQLHTAGVDGYADRYRRADGAFDVTDTDWAAVGADDMPEYYFNWSRIPNLNYDSPAVRAWLLDVIDEWAAVVDGFRADVAWGVPHGFWKEVADRVPDDVLLLDETIPHDPLYGEGEFHLHYGTDLYGALDAVGGGEEPADAIADALDRAAWLGFDDPSAQLRYVENHDEDRYLATHGEAALRAAAAITFTLPGAPMIYAGQERGNRATRGPFRWHDGDNALTDYHRRLSALRDAEPLLRADGVDFDGAAAAVDVVAGDGDRVTAYERRGDADDRGNAAGGNDDGADDRTDADRGGSRDRLLVVVNFAAEPATVRVPDWVDVDLFADEPIDGTIDIGDVAVLGRRVQN